MTPSLALRAMQDGRYARIVINHAAECERIMQRATEATGLTRAQVMSKSRIEKIVVARFVAMHLMHRTGMSSVAVAEYFGQTHGAALHAFRRVEEMREVDARFAGWVVGMEAGLGEYIQPCVPNVKLNHKR